MGKYWSKLCISDAENKAMSLAWLDAASIRNSYDNNSDLRCFVNASVYGRSFTSIGGNCTSLHIDVEFFRSLDLLYKSFGCYTYHDIEASLNCAAGAIRRLACSSMSLSGRYDLILSMVDDPERWPVVGSYFCQTDSIHQPVYTGVLLVLAHEAGHSLYFSHEKYRNSIREYIQELECKYAFFGVNDSVSTLTNAITDDLYFRLSIEGCGETAVIRNPKLPEWYDEMAADIYALDSVILHMKHIHAKRELMELGCWFLMRSYEIQAMLDSLLDSNRSDSLEYFLMRRHLLLSLINSDHYLNQDKWRMQKINVLSLSYNHWSKEILLPVMSYLMGQIFVGKKCKKKRLKREKIGNIMDRMGYVYSNIEGSLISSGEFVDKKILTHNVIDVKRIAKTYDNKIIIDWCRHTDTDERGMQYWLENHVVRR